MMYTSCKQSRKKQNENCEFQVSSCISTTVLRTAVWRRPIQTPRSSHLVATSSSRLQIQRGRRRHSINSRRTAAFTRASSWTCSDSRFSVARTSVAPSSTKRRRRLDPQGYSYTRTAFHPGTIKHEHASFTRIVRGFSCFLKWTKCFFSFSFYDYLVIIRIRSL